MTERKKKILYPVGTKVRVVKSVLLNDSSIPHDKVGLVAKVVGYHKGLDYPYELDGCGDFQFNVQELEKYSEQDCRPYETAKRCEPTFTLDEVKEFAREEARRAVSAYDAERAFESEMTALLEGFNKLTATEVAEKEKTTMNKKELTLRQKVKYFALSKDEKILRESGFHDTGGSLTEQGRRIVVDVLWEGMTAAERKKVVEAVAATLPKEK